jgi:hypothetical protein
MEMMSKQDTEVADTTVNEFNYHSSTETRREQRCLPVGGIICLASILECLVTTHQLRRCCY